MEVPSTLEIVISDLSRSMSNQERLMEHLELTIDNMDKRNNLKFQGLQRSINEMESRLIDKINKQQEFLNGQIIAIGRKKASMSNQESNPNRTSEKTMAEHPTGQCRNLSSELGQTKMSISEKIMEVLLKIDMYSIQIENVMDTVKNNSKKVVLGFDNLKSHVDDLLRNERIREEDSRPEFDMKFEIQRISSKLSEVGRKYDVDISGLKSEVKEMIHHSEDIKDLVQHSEEVQEMVQNSEENGKKLDKLLEEIYLIGNDNKHTVNMRELIKKDVSSIVKACNNVVKNCEDTLSRFSVDKNKIELSLESSSLDVKEEFLKLKKDIEKFHKDKQKARQTDVSVDKTDNIESKIDRHLQYAILDIANVVVKECEQTREMMRDTTVDPSQLSYNVYFRIRDFDKRVNTSIRVFSPPWYFSQLDSCLRGYVRFSSDDKLDVRLLHGRLPKLLALEPKPKKDFRFSVSVIDDGEKKEKVLKAEEYHCVNEAKQVLHGDSFGWQMGYISYDELIEGGFISNNCIVLKYSIDFQ